MDANKDKQLYDVRGGAKPFIVQPASLLRGEGAKQYRDICSQVWIVFCVGARTGARHGYHCETINVQTIFQDYLKAIRTLIWIAGLSLPREERKQAQDRGQRCPCDATGQQTRSVAAFCKRR